MGNFIALVLLFALIGIGGTVAGAVVAAFWFWIALLVLGFALVALFER